MKSSLIIAMTAVASLSFWNFNANTREFVTDPSAQFTNTYQDSNAYLNDSYAGYRLKKIAAGEDANKNKYLDESEKMKKLEPGAYDNIHFIDKRKIRIYGMGMDFYGLYKIKWENGRTRMFVVITSDTTLREPLSESSHKFEILYGGDYQPGKPMLVIIPPIYLSMLCMYSIEK